MMYSISDQVLVLLLIVSDPSLAALEGSVDLSTGTEAGQFNHVRGPIKRDPLRRLRFKRGSSTKKESGHQDFYESSASSSSPSATIAPTPTANQPSSVSSSGKKSSGKKHKSIPISSDEEEESKETSAEDEPASSSKSSKSGKKGKKNGKRGKKGKKDDTPAPSAAATASAFPTFGRTKSPAPTTSLKPSPSPSNALSSSPTGSSFPTFSQTDFPTAMPVPGASEMPTKIATENPSAEPSFTVTEMPSVNPSIAPSQSPTIAGASASPSGLPSSIPSQTPTTLGDSDGSDSPSGAPSQFSSQSPSQNPTISGGGQVSENPSMLPSEGPSQSPTGPGGGQGSAAPSAIPSQNPTGIPSGSPSEIPSNGPSQTPSARPSTRPSTTPSVSASPSISTIPSAMPSVSASPSASLSPSAVPSQSPSQSPTGQATSGSPSASPDASFSVAPSQIPSTMSPSQVPSNSPNEDAEMESGEGNFLTDVDTTGVANVEAALAFTNAASRWSQVIVGNLEDYTFDEDEIEASDCPNLPSFVDDIYICASTVPIDGASGILGSAGPEYARFGTNVLTVSGVMMFDTADVDNLLLDGSFEGVVRHEMGHVYGLGTLWEINGLLGPDACSYNLDTKASNEYQALSGCTSAVPLENDGGPGTECGHWEEDCYVHELMTGYSTGELPLSRTTVASLEDIGYEVDYSAADPFPITSLGSSCVCTGLQEEKNGKIVSGIGITSLAQNNIGNRNIDAKDETNTGKVGMAPIEQSKNPHPNNVRERNQRKGTIGQPGKKEHRSKHALATNEGPFGKLYKKKRNKRTGRGKKNKKRGRGGGQNRRKLSEGGRRVAEKYGQMLLQKRKQKKVGLTEKDTVRYIGDRFVSILYIEENVVYSVDVKGQDL